MGQIDQLLRRVAGAPVRTVLLWRSRGISWKVITSNLLPEPSLSIIHHQLLPSRAGNAPRFPATSPPEQVPESEQEKDGETLRRSSDL